MNPNPNSILSIHGKKWCPMNKSLKLIAFDIEIAQSIPDGVEDWSRQRPLGISCAATLTAGEPAVVWYGNKASADYSSQMNPVEAQELVKYLQAQVEHGRTILTWNGLGFDFDILAEESGMVAECSELARGHIDMMFHVFCMKGYPLGLDKAAKGMGLKGKPPGITGEMAPRMWADGRFQEVLEYVQQDVHTLLELAHAIDLERQLRWISNSGRPQRLSLPSGWLTVKEAQNLPLPDTSWMSNPWPRSKFTKWMEPKT
jgi:hypothetical protein